MSSLDVPDPVQRVSGSSCARHRVLQSFGGACSGDTGLGCRWRVPKFLIRGFPAVKDLGRGCSSLHSVCPRLHSGQGDRLHPLWSGPPETCPAGTLLQGARQGAPQSPCTDAGFSKPGTGASKVSARQGPRCPPVSCRQSPPQKHKLSNATLPHGMRPGPRPWLARAPKRAGTVPKPVSSPLHRTPLGGPFPLSPSLQGLGDDPTAPISPGWPRAHRPTWLCSRCSRGPGRGALGGRQGVRRGQGSQGALVSPGPTASAAPSHKKTTPTKQAPPQVPPIPPAPSLSRPDFSPTPPPTSLDPAPYLSPAHLQATPFLVQPYKALGSGPAPASLPPSSSCPGSHAVLLLSSWKLAWTLQPTAPSGYKQMEDLEGRL